MRPICPWCNEPETTDIGWCCETAYQMEAAHDETPDHSDAWMAEAMALVGVE